MAQTSWPFENVDTTESQFSQWARNIGEGVKGSSGGTELKPFADSSGMNVKVPAGQSMVRGHYYVSTAQETLTIANSDPANPRIDSVVLELDPAANTIILKVITGVAASSPTATDPIQTDTGVYQQLLATVAVAAGAGLISAGNVTDQRSFLGTTSVAYSNITGLPTTFPSDWDTMVDKPSTFTPSAHTQNASTIITTSTDKSANYTLVSSDENTYIRSTGSAITITVPDVLADGESVNFIQAGAGQITFAGSGITLNSADALLKTAKQFAGATVVKSGGAYYLIGNLG
jgi:hypothetical protein